MAPKNKNKNIRHPPIDPPCQTIAKPVQIPPYAAQASIAKYLKKSATRPFLHPDSFLSTAGIRFAIGTGPSGGIALHHLRRIEAGLRGEVLEKETQEELEAKFGPLAGDDLVLDGRISKAEKELKKARKRKREEIEDWVSSSSDPALGEGEAEYPSYGTGYKEIESFANTPLHHPSYSGGWEASHWDEAQDPYEYDLQQRVWTKDPQRGEGGAVGSLVRQDGRVPEVVVHDRDGKLSKEERKKAKKQRKEARKMELARANEETRIQRPAEVDAVAGAEDERVKEERKEERKARRKEEKRRREAEAEANEVNGVKAHSKDDDEEKRAKKKRKKDKGDKKDKKAKSNGIKVEDDPERQKRKKEKKDKKKAKKGEE